MTHEKQGLLLAERNEPQPDADLLNQLHQIFDGKPAFYKNLKLPEHQQKKVTDAWREGRDETLKASHLDMNELQAQEARLLQFKDELLSNEEGDQVTIQLYLWKVNEYVANIRMLMASHEGDMRRFRGWNQFVYGSPDPTIYAAALDSIAHDAEKLLDGESHQHRNIEAAASKVLEMLEGKRGDRQLIMPDPEVFEAVRNDHMRELGFYGILLAGIDISESKVDREIGEPYLRRALGNIGIPDFPIIDAEDSTWGVSSQGVERPVKYSLPQRRFIGLPLGHEIASHLLERVNGARGPFALAADGFDRHELGNEGRALIREQVVYSSFEEFTKLVRWRDILRRHIAISKGLGVDEARPQTSLEVHRFIKPIDLMYQTKRFPDDPERAEVEATKRTDNLLLRVLKGTNGQGGAYLKDMVYLEGNVATWQTARQRGPRAIAEGDYGKFNINEPRHTKPQLDRGLLTV